MLLVSKCSLFSFPVETYLKSDDISSFSHKSQWGKYTNARPSALAAGIKPQCHYYNFCLCIAVCVYAHMQHSLHVQVRGGTSSSSAFHHGDGTQDIKLGGKHPHLLRHPFSPLFLFHSVDLRQALSPVCLLAFSFLRLWQEKAFPFI